jgi:hypothetical protein
MQGVSRTAKKVVHGFKIQTLQNPLRLTSDTLYTGNFAFSGRLNTGALVCRCTKPFIDAGFDFSFG